MKIEIQEYLEEQPNGDRATSKTPSSRFEVVFISELRGGFTLHTFNQYDSYSCHVGSRAGAWQGALEYALAAAKIIGDVKVTHVVFSKKVVPQVTQWVREAENDRFVPES